MNAKRGPTMGGGLTMGGWLKIGLAIWARHWGEWALLVATLRGDRLWCAPMETLLSVCFHLSHLDFPPSPSNSMGDPLPLSWTVDAFSTAFLPWRTYAKFIKVKRSFNRNTNLIRRGLSNRVSQLWYRLRGHKIFRGLTYYTTQNSISINRYSNSKGRGFDSQPRWPMPGLGCVPQFKPLCIKN